MTRTGERHFDKGGAGHHDATLDDMVGQPRDRRRIEAVLPDRLGGRQPFAEQWVLLRARRLGKPLAFREPEALAPPGIGRQRHGNTALRVEGVEIDRHPRAVTAPERHPQRVALRLLPPQRRERSAAAAVRLEALAQIAVEDRMRSDFEKEVEPVGGQRGDRRGEQHRFADIVPPIGSAQPLGGDLAAGDGRDESGSSRLRRQPVQPLQQLPARMGSITRL